MINSNLIASADSGSASRSRAVNPNPLMASTDVTPSPSLSVHAPTSNVVEKRKVAMEIAIVTAYVVVSEP